MKLSAPQERLLEELRKGPVIVLKHYSPAIALVRKGIAEWAEKPTIFGKRIVLRLVKP